MGNRCLVGLMVLMLVLLPATRVLSADPGSEDDLRWSSWLGCWELHSQSVNRVELDTPAGQLVCLAPLAEAVGVKILTLENGKLTAQDGFVDDGQRHSHEGLPGCVGWQRAYWSGDSERLYLSSELSCDQGPVRKSAGVHMLSADHTWVEIRQLRFGEGSQVSVRRFVPAQSEAAAAMGMPSAGRQRLMPATALSADDLIEATAALEPEVVESLLLECGYDGTVGGQELLRLADAGVDDGIIDLVVALSFPDRYEIHGRAVFERIEQQTGMVFTSSYVSVWPWWGHHYGSSWWYWYPVYPHPPLPGVPSDSEPGKVVKGKGYTRARVVPVGGEGGNLGQAIARAVSGNKGSGSGDQGSSAGDSTSGGETATSGSSGTSSTGRKAVPRPKGDDR